MASAQQIENSQAAANFGHVLMWIFIGLSFLWVLGELTKRVSGLILPGLPMLIICALIGLVLLGLAHSYGF